MATPQKPNRVSSLFSLGHSKNDSASSPSQSNYVSHAPDASRDHSPESPGSTLQSTSKRRLHKRSPSAGLSLPTLNTMAAMPLVPPPVINADGLPRPQSAYSSGQASREESRSRPTTPNMLAPYDNPPSSRPQTPTSAKASKRRSWLPGKSEKDAVGQERHEPQAWIAGLKEHMPYNLAPLINGEKASHLASSNKEYSADFSLGSGAME
jgi:hypothetical protein